MGFSAITVLVALTLASCSGKGLPPVLDISRLEPDSTECRSSLESLRNGLRTGDLWALKMWDASVKSPVGLLSQTAAQYGDFDECLSIGDPSPVTGQFCLVDVIPTSNGTSWPAIKWGLCVPSSCSRQDLRAAIQAYMDSKATPGEVKVEIVPRACTTRDTVSTSITLNDIVYCVVLVCIVVVVVAATTREIWWRPDYDGIAPPLCLGQCLSARHGWYSLLRFDQQIPGVNLLPLYGLHTTTFFFVVLGHRFGVHMYFMSVTNYSGVERMFVDPWYSLWTGHMDLFVDVFFFLSAFLLSVFYYAELHKRFVSPIMVYLYRICRIIPVYAVVVFFYATWLRQLGDGPFWNMFMDEEQSKCKSYWWTNLLFINNYVETSNMCLLQSWYITCDFQLMVVGTLLVFLLQKKPKAGIIATALLFIASTLAPFIGTYFSNRSAILIFYKDFWHDPRHHEMFTSIYIKGHYRGTSYLMGLLAGCYVYSHRQDQPITRGRAHALQAAGFLCCLIIYWSGSLFYDSSIKLDRLIVAIYAASFHTLFGIGLTLMIVSFCLGKSTPLSRMFSWSGFVPLSKLSYCVYLIHNIPQFLWIGSSRTTVYINPLEMVSWSIADVVISLLVALPLYLTIETPVRYIIKFIITGSPPPPLPQTAKAQERYSLRQEMYNFDKR